jgi:hypothetical protein
MERATWNLTTGVDFVFIGFGIRPLHLSGLGTGTGLWLHYGECDRFGVYHQLIELEHGAE